MGEYRLKPKVTTCDYTRSDLLEAGDGEQQPDIQLGVVLSQRLVSVVADELHHGAEGQRLGEAVLPVPVVDLYQLVVAPFPETTSLISNTLKPPSGELKVPVNTKCT